MHLPNVAAIAAATVLSMSALATAQTISATEPNQLMEVLRGFGSATLEADDAGDPRIQGRIEGVRYTLWFYGCESNANCKNVIFSAGFSGTKATSEMVNIWNRDKKFGKAYLDDTGDPWLEMAVNLYGGVSQTNWDDTVDWWRVASVEFRDTIYGN